jgi:hypothetical protein
LPDDLLLLRSIQLPDSAHFRIEDHASVDYDRFESSQTVVCDRLGKGKKLVVTGSSAEKPSLILEIRLYEDRPFVSLNVGIDNVTDSDIRIMEFSPMKGNAFEALENDGQNLRAAVNAEISGVDFPFSNSEAKLYSSEESSSLSS